MTKINYKAAKFLLSVAKMSQLPPDNGIEVAIVGRSNAGKSSVLNQLTQNKSLARVSKTPGRTQHINLFGLDENRRLADLPGYGYAKVPPKMKEHWEKTLDEYLRTRDCLKGLILVMDIRHPLREFDRQLLLWCSTCDLPVHILLNKCDKLSLGAAKKTFFAVQKELTVFENTITLQIFSAMRSVGVKELIDTMNQWFSDSNS
jgi:GTP-binding protein